MLILKRRKMTVSISCIHRQRISVIEILFLLIQIIFLSIIYIYIYKTFILYITLKNIIVFRKRIFFPKICCSFCILS